MLYNSYVKDKYKWKYWYVTFLELSLKDSGLSLLFHFPRPFLSIYYLYVVNVFQTLIAMFIH